MRSLSRLFLLPVLSALACSSDGGPECPDDPVLGEAPVECIDWESVAEARGFPTEPDAFFPFLQSGCSVEPTVASATLEDLVDASVAVLFGRLVDVVPVPARSFEERPEYEPQFTLAVDEVVVGELPAELDVIPACGTTGKIAGLEYALPTEDTFLFFLEANAGELEGTFGFTYFYLGVVEDGPAGARFALDPGGEIAPPPLDDFASTAELADAVRDL
jgi:hypothetical protein